MQWDDEEPAKRARQRDAALRGYLRGDLGSFSPFYRRRLKEAGIDAGGIRGLADLGQLRPVTWDDLAEDPGAFLLRPTRRELSRSGDRRAVLALLAGRLTGRLDRVNRSVVEPRYKPVLWLAERGVPFGVTDADLDLVAEAGSRVLALAGLDRRDLVVGLTETSDGLPHWQLVLGARQAGVPAVHLGGRPRPGAVVAARPTTLAGPPDALARALASVAGANGVLDGLHTLLVTGADPDAGARDALALAAAGAMNGEDEPPAVVASWAPPGARAQWGECRRGAGFHTFPDLEIVEVGRGGGLHASGPGELIWSALGWRGTAVLRLLTGARAELVDVTCEACERRGPMVLTGSRDPLATVDLLSEQDDVAAFQVELARRDGADEVLVFLALRRGADVADVVESLDAELAATQYVVLNRRQVDARVRSAGARVVDAR